MMADKRSELERHCLERLTGIEPALSAWESDRSGSLTAPSWAAVAPSVIVTDPAIPGLMARRWPAAGWLTGYYELAPRGAADIG